ncbi:dipeptide ABC transporter ATP-binding protein [bacterium]|nr:dipeptide ABC transporter ATP-binding protein [bacterium]
MTSAAPILEISGLKKHFPVGTWRIGSKRETVKAVDGISFNIYEGETLGIVGESGCGKSTLARLLLRLIPVTDGRVFFKGTDLLAMNRLELKRIRKQMQIIFQDPFSSLDPRKRIGKIIDEPLRIHGVRGSHNRTKIVQKLMERVGINYEWADRYPHEFSGGQRQRIAIARALVLNPSLIICDEPVSALDVSIQAQVLNLFKNLQRELGLTYVFISHDLSVIRHICKRIAVMYLGKIIEISDADDLFASPAHPYTQALLSAIPVSHPKHVKKRTILTGDVPNPRHPPKGCRFHTRCPIAEPSCSASEPPMKNINSNHQAACHLI